MEQFRQRDFAFHNNIISNGKFTDSNERIKMTTNDDDDDEISSFISQGKRPFKIPLFLSVNLEEIMKLFFGCYFSHLFLPHFCYHRKQQLKRYINDRPNNNICAFEEIISKCKCKINIRTFESSAEKKTNGNNFIINDTHSECLRILHSNLCIFD